MRDTIKFGGAAADKAADTADKLSAGADDAEIARPTPHTLSMFIVTEAERATIKATLKHSGEFTAMLELQRMFRGISVDQARECVRTIGLWKPLETSTPEALRVPRRRRGPAIVYFPNTRPI